MLNILNFLKNNLNDFNNSSDVDIDLYVIEKYIKSDYYSNRIINAKLDRFEQCS